MTAIRFIVLSGRRKEMLNSYFVIGSELPVVQSGSYTDIVIGYWHIMCHRHMLQRWGPVLLAWLHLVAKTS